MYPKYRYIYNIYIYINVFDYLNLKKTIVHLHLISDLNYLEINFFT